MLSVKYLLIVASKFNGQKAKNLQTPLKGNVRALGTFSQTSVKGCVSPSNYIADFIRARPIIFEDRVYNSTGSDR
jgi:hypothetical protein